MPQASDESRNRGIVAEKPYGFAVLNALGEAEYRGSRAYSHDFYFRPSSLSAANGLFAGRVEFIFFGYKVDNPEWARINKHQFEVGKFPSMLLKVEGVGLPIFWMYDMRGLEDPSLYKPYSQVRVDNSRRETFYGIQVFKKRWLASSGMRWVPNVIWPEDDERGGNTLPFDYG